MVYLGRLYSRAKNLENLFYAVLPVVKEQPVIALFCGEGPDRPLLERLVRNHGVAGKILLPGVIANPWSLMKKAALLVSVSHYEGCPNVVLEAMACGCPVVVSDIPAHREILDEASALLVNPDDPDEIAQAIRMALAAPDAARRRARLAREKVMGRSIAAMAQRYEELYRDILAIRKVFKLMETVALLKRRKPVKVCGRRTMAGKPKILFIAVLPPPFHGVPIANRILLSSEFIQGKYELILVPIKRNVLQSGGNFSWGTLLDDLSLMVRTVSSLLTERPELTYFCLAQTRLGLWRDAGLIGLARLLGSKCLVHLRGSNFRNIFMGKLTPGERQLVRLALKSLAGVIVLDQGLTWIFHGLVPSRRIFVLANGLPENHLDPARIAAAMERRGKSQKIRVTYLSNLMPGKGFATFLETAAILAPRRGESKILPSLWPGPPRTRQRPPRSRSSWTAGIYPARSALPAQSWARKNGNC